MQESTEKPAIMTRIVAWRHQGESPAGLSLDPVMKPPSERAARPCRPSAFSNTLTIYGLPRIVNRTQGRPVRRAALRPSGHPRGRGAVARPDRGSDLHEPELCVRGGGPPRVDV